MTDARRYTGSLASSATMTASTSAEVNPFSERAISYDRNGNITALTRYGQAAASAEDILAYTYSGNRIASIATLAGVTQEDSFNSLLKLIWIILVKQLAMFSDAAITLLIYLIHQVC